MRACVRECWWERDDLDTRAGWRPLFMRAKRSCAQKRTGGIGGEGTGDRRQATGEAEATADWVTSQWNGMFEVPEEVAVQPPRPGDSRVRSDRQTPGACRHSGGSHSSGEGGPPRVHHGRWGRDTRRSSSGRCTSRVESYIPGTAWRWGWSRSCWRT